MQHTRCRPACVWRKLFRGLAAKMATESGARVSVEYQRMLVAVMYGG